MSWNIPPVGFCAVCLMKDPDTHQAAHTVIDGTALCRDHVNSTTPAAAPEKPVIEGFKGPIPQCCAEPPPDKAHFLKPCIRFEGHEGPHGYAGTYWDDEPDDGWELRGRLGELVLAHTAGCRPGDQWDTVGAILRHFHITPR